jgi:hypothetical protein
MTNYLESKIAPDSKSFVKYLLMQLDLSLRTGGNYFGNVILKTNVEIAVNYVDVAMMLEKTGKVDIEKTFDIIAKAINLMMIGTRLLPTPPIPPTVMPNLIVPLPCAILFPGDIANLKKDLKRALSDNVQIKTPSMSVNFLNLALRKYFLTLGGLYFGMLYVGVALVPAPPIPWIGII